MTRQEMIKRLAEVIAKDMMEWDKEELLERLTEYVIKDLADVTDEQLDIACIWERIE